MEHIFGTAKIKYAVNIFFFRIDHIVQLIKFINFNNTLASRNITYFASEKNLLVLISL